MFCSTISPDINHANGCCVHRGYNRGNLILSHHAAPLGFPRLCLLSWTPSAFFLYLCTIPTSIVEVLRPDVLAGSSGTLLYLLDTGPNFLSNASILTTTRRVGSVGWATRMTTARITTGMPHAGSFEFADPTPTCSEETTSQDLVS